MQETNKIKRRPTVKANCIWCWACAMVARDVFEIDENFWVAKAVRLDDYEGKSVDDAISVCPVGAIEWIEMK